MTSESFIVALKRAQEEFLARVPLRIAAIQDHAKAAAKGDHAALGLLHNDLHALFGTSATYGYVDISARVTEATNCLKTLELKGWPITKIETSSLEDAIKQIQTAYEASRDLRPDLGG